jgi:hypothetical protein
MEILSKLFGNPSKVKLMRLFLFNPETFYSSKGIAKRSKLSSTEVKKDVNALMTLGMVRSREIVREESVKTKSTKTKSAKPAKAKKILAFGLNPKFPYLAALKNLLITASLRADESLTKKFAKSGKLKLLLASGVFLHEWDTRVDLLIVGDELRIDNLQKVISVIEAEIGKELSYSAFDTEDFEYRLGVHDRLIRDILDSPHTILIDKLGISPR